MKDACPCTATISLPQAIKAFIYSTYPMPQRLYCPRYNPLFIVLAIMIYNYVRPENMESVGTNFAMC